MFMAEFIYAPLHVYFSFYYNFLLLFVFLFSHYCVISLNKMLCLPVSPLFFPLLN